MKHLKVLAVAFLATSLTACAGLKNQATEGVRNVHTLAVVEITADSTVGNFGGEKQQPSTLGALGAMVSLAKGKSLKETAAAVSHPADELLASAVPTLFGELKAVKGLTVMDADKVVNNPAYKALPAKMNHSGDVITAKGYKALNLNQRKTVQELCQTLGVDGVMTVGIKFQKKMSTGIGANGTATGATNLDIKIVNKDGDVVWSRSANLIDNGDTTVAILDGVYDKSKMNPLILNSFNVTTKHLVANALARDREVAK